MLHACKPTICSIVSRLNLECRKLIGFIIFISLSISVSVALSVYVLGKEIHAPCSPLNMYCNCDKFKQKVSSEMEKKCR